MSLNPGAHVRLASGGLSEDRLAALPGASQAHLSAAALRSHWAERRPIERACYLIGGALVLSGLFHLGVFAVRGGPWDGPVSWRKPATFGLSFGSTLITISWSGPT
jgi:hypothetical protein